jgi:hypothetical protein
MKPHGSQTPAIGPCYCRSPKFVSWGFLTKNFHSHLIFIMRSAHLAHLIILHLITLVIFAEDYRVSIFFSSVSCLLDSHILISTLFTNALNLCPSLTLRDQVSHPYLHCNELCNVIFVSAINEIQGQCCMENDKERIWKICGRLSALVLYCRL